MPPARQRLDLRDTLIDPLGKGALAQCLQFSKQRRVDHWHTQTKKALSAHMGREGLSRGSTQFQPMPQALALERPLTGPSGVPYLLSCVPAPTHGGFSHRPDGGGSQPLTPIFCRLFPVLLVPIDVLLYVGGRYRTRTYDLIDVNDAL